MNLRLLAVTAALLFLSQSLTASIINIPSQFASIQAGLNAAATGDIILVQPGTYNESLTWPLLDSISLISAGTETNTIIDANRLGRVIDFPNSGPVKTATIRGFTLQNGLHNSRGGGIYNERYNLTLNNLIFMNNHVEGLSFTSGGAIYLRRRTATLTNIAFIQNGCGGPPTLGPSPNATGGALYTATNSTLHLNNVSFNGNFVEGTSFGFGAAMLINGTSGNWAGVTVINNVCRTGATTGGAVSIESNSNIVANGVYITNNDALGTSDTRAGGLNVDFSTFSVIGLNVACNSAFTNTGTGSAAGIRCMGSTLLISNGLVAANQYGHNGSTPGFSAGISIQGASTVSMVNTTVADNIASGIGSRPLSFGLQSNSSTAVITVSNSIFYNPGTQPEIDGMGISAEFSCIRGGFPGTNIINANPLFVGLDDYHLNPASPCVDAGTASNFFFLDLEGEARPQGAGVDMGCFEGPGGGNFPFLCGGSALILDGSSIPFQVSAHADGEALLSWESPQLDVALSYTVESSSDGESFQSIAQFSPTKQHSLQWVDQSPANGINFYRIQARGADGGSFTSEIRSIKLTVEEALVHNLYPNPASQSVFLQVKSTPLEALVSYQIIRTDGTIVLQGTPSTELEIPIPVAHLPAGRYAVLVQNGIHRAYKPLVIVH